MEYDDRDSRRAALAADDVDELHDKLRSTLTEFGVEVNNFKHRKTFNTPDEERKLIAARDYVKQWYDYPIPRDDGSSASRRLIRDWISGVKDTLKESPPWMVYARQVSQQYDNPDPEQQKADKKKSRLLKHADRVATDLAIPIDLIVDQAEHRALVKHAEKTFYELNVKRAVEGDFKSLGALGQNAKYVAARTELNKAAADKADKSGAGSACAFITVNPRPEVAFEQLEAATKKFLKHKWVTSYELAYEQRGGDPKPNKRGVVPAIGDGFHVHILVGRNGKKPCQLITETRSSFSSVVGSDAAVNIRFVRPQDILTFRGYLRGDKRDPTGHKASLSVADRQWRTDRGLSQIYCSAMALPTINDPVLQEQLSDVPPSTPKIKYITQ